MTNDGVPLVRIRELTKSYVTAGNIFSGLLGRRSAIRAVDKVSFDIRRGETLGMVGESGSGKTTLGKCILRLADPVHGEVLYEGRDIMALRGRELRRQRGKMQMIFQNPHAALHHSMKVRSILTEALKIGGCRKEEMEDRIRCLLKNVHLSDKLDRYPFELSGGERRRMGIARILATEPEFIVADEPIASLDVSVRSEMLGLLKRLKRERGLTYLYISHDIGIIKNICDRIVVMYMGHIVEIGKNENISFTHCRHPYTEELLKAARFLSIVGEQEDIDLSVEIEDIPDKLPSGCSFYPRCTRYREANTAGIPEAEACVEEAPSLKPLEESPEHRVACWLV